MSDDDITRRLMEQRDREFRRQAQQTSAPPDPKARLKAEVSEARQLTREVLARLKELAEAKVGEGDDIEDWELIWVERKGKSRQVAGYPLVRDTRRSNSGIESTLTIWLLENGHYVDGRVEKEINDGDTYHLVPRVIRQLRRLAGPPTP